MSKRSQKGMAATPERIKVKKPPIKLLEHYYKLWLKGANNETIMRSLSAFNELCGVTREKISERYLKRYASAFHEYCRQTVAHDSRERLTSEGIPAEVALTAERREKLLELVGNGASINKAADLLGIPLLTITEYWYVADETLRQQVETARDLHDFEVIEATRRRAIGYTYDAPEFVEESEDDEGTVKLDADGNQVMIGAHHKTKSKVVKKTVHVPGSTGSQKLWLVNRLGWSDSPTGVSGDDQEVEYDVRERLYEDD